MWSCYVRLTAFQFSPTSSPRNSGSNWPATSETAPLFCPDHVPDYPRSLRSAPESDLGHADGAASRIPIQPHSFPLRHCGATITRILCKAPEDSILFSLSIRSSVIRTALRLLARDFHHSHKDQHQACSLNLDRGSSLSSLMWSLSTDCMFRLASFLVAPACQGAGIKFLTPWNSTPDLETWDDSFGEGPNRICKVIEIVVPTTIEICLHTSQADSVLHGHMIAINFLHAEIVGDRSS